MAQYWRRCFWVAFGLAMAMLPLATTVAAPRPVLVLAFSPLPPWKVINAQGQASGPYLEIVQRLANRAGMTLEVRPCPLLRCLEMLRRGEADVGIGIAPGPGRDEIVDFLRPAFAEGSTVCFLRRREDATLRLMRYDDLRPLRIGVTDGAHYFPRFDQDTQLHKDSAPDKISNLRKLLAHRTDVVVMVCGESEQLLRRKEFNGRIESAGMPVKTGPRNVVLARQSPRYADKERLQRALRAMVESGEVQRLLAPIEQ